ncbi:MAG: type IV pilus twitching motility protein PilT [Desulfonatronovibrionaceae bacterium]
MLRSHMDQIIDEVIAAAPRLSDIIFTAGKPIQAEVDGDLRDVKVQPDLGRLKPFQTESMARVAMGQNLRLYKDQIRTGSCDLTYVLPKKARFRVNVFNQRGTVAMVMRKLAMEIPTISGLDLPPMFNQMTEEQYGLILVTGGTGTGKSTSLAALIDSINEAQAKHIVTLEDPIEYLHRHKKSVVNQRELGNDFDTFASGLRAALRQAPKVILVGEIRDRETVNIALEAAETGHLVLGTLHTSDAGQTISRIIGMYDTSEERFIRMRLSESLKFVVSQRLMPRIKGGRVAAFEIMRNNLRVRETILRGEDADTSFYNLVSEGDAYGMFTFDQHLLKLYEKRQISENIALLNASDKTLLKQMIDKIKVERGEEVTDIKGLEVDWSYDDTVS